MLAHLNQFESMLEATTKDGLLLELTKQCDQLGFTYYFYSPFIEEDGREKFFKDDSSIVQGKGLIGQNAFTNYPASWIQRYQEAGYIKRDPVVRHIASSSLPVFWTEACKSPAEDIVFDEAHQHGLVDGITIPVNGKARERALLSVATGIDLEKDPQRQLLTAGATVLMALHFHEAVQRIDSQMNSQELDQLTTREKDCLQWAARGKTSWEISNILSIAERTVIFHMTNATKKLRAANRRQAVVRALSLRLIVP